MSPLVRLATCDAVLVRRSRFGDRGAARRLAARHLERITYLSGVVGSSAEQSAALAQQGFALALRSGRPFEDALVTAFDRLAATVDDADEARERLARLLIEVEQRPADEVARLLGLTPDHLPMAHSPHPARACRGWPLASRRAGLTHAEVHAGVGHLELCRRCRDRLAAIERTRAQLLGGSAGVAGAVAAAQLGPWGGAAATSVGAVVTSKAAAGLIAAVGAAVLATGGTAVVADRAESHQPTGGPAPTDSIPSRPAPSMPASVSTSPPVGPTHTGLPLPLPTRSTADAPTPLPTDVPALPVPLPTLPVPLPTLPALPLPDPLPSIVASILDLP